MLMWCRLAPASRLTVIIRWFCSVNALCFIQCSAHAAALDAAIFVHRAYRGNILRTDWKPTRCYGIHMMHDVLLYVLKSMHEVLHLLRALIPNVVPCRRILRQYLPTAVWFECTLSALCCLRERVWVCASRALAPGRTAAICCLESAARCCRCQLCCSLAPINTCAWYGALQ
jgi:hypothetical protein